VSKEDIIRMAREAGWTQYSLLHPVEVQRLEHFAALVAAAEREAMVKKDLTIDSAYKERNQLVALLSTCFPAGKAKTSIEGWDEAWHGCVYIDFPWGQASWHYHERDEWMFEHLPQYQKQWDGHTTEQKYSAIAQAIRARGVQQKPQITHADGCWSWGPAHYECACKELAKAKGWEK
jgi:hypothetical protein